MNNLQISLDNNDEFFRTMANITCRRILKLLLLFPGLNINAIALQLGQTQANISTQVRHLQEANLVSIQFKIGRHGVSKTVNTRYQTITIEVKEKSQ